MSDDRLAKLEARMTALENASGLYASEKDLDSSRTLQARVKFDPRGWRGGSCKGRVLWQCPPEFLDAYASTLSYMAEHPKPGKERYAEYDRLDAGRARGYARRLRSGWTPPAGSCPPVDSVTDSAVQAPAFEPPAFNPPSFETPTFDEEDDLIPF